MKLLNFFKSKKTSTEPQAKEARLKSASVMEVVKQPETPEPEPKVIYFDAELFDREIKVIDYLLPRMQKIHEDLSQYLPRPLNMTEFQKCFSIQVNDEVCQKRNISQEPNQNIDEILLDVILSESEMKLNGVQLDREQSRKLVKFQDLRSIRQKIANVCFNSIPGMPTPDAVPIPWNLFKIKNGKIVHNKAGIEAYRKSLTVYTSNEGEFERMTIAEQLAEKIAELEAAIKDYKPGSFEIPGAIIYDEYQKKYRPTISLITKKRKEKN
jgi:hypothetical protein